MTGITLDAGALLAVDRGDRHISLMLKRGIDAGARVTISAAVLAQVVRNPLRQARVMRLIRHETTDIVPIDLPHAVNIGRLLASSGTTDLADAHVVLCAQVAHQPIVTSDPKDLQALDPRATLIAI